MPLPILLFSLIALFGPTFAALIMAGIEGGTSGIKNLLSRWKIGRVGFYWYLIIPVMLIGMYLAAIYIYVGISASQPQVNWGLWPMFFYDFFLTIVFLGGGLGEETGWRGYALPRMLESHDALTSGLILGVLWAGWHVPFLLIPGVAIGIPVDPLVFLMFFLDVISLSVIMAWVFNNTRGSVLVAFLFHALNASVMATLLLRIFHFGNLMTAELWVYWIITALQWILVLFLIAIFKPAHLSRKQEGFANPSQPMATAMQKEMSVHG